jgi:hypothetical protein
VKPQLPPPDPHESTETPGGLELESPTAIFVAGPATPEADRAANRILDLRPGLLLVFARAA